MELFFSFLQYWLIPVRRNYFDAFGTMRCLFEIFIMLSLSCLSIIFFGGGGSVWYLFTKVWKKLLRMRIFKSTDDSYLFHCAAGLLKVVWTTLRYLNQNVITRYKIFKLFNIQKILSTDLLTRISVTGTLSYIALHC